METDSTHVGLEKIMKENSELIKENNQLLKKIHRNSVWSFWVRVLWYSILIGLPFAIYFTFGSFFTTYFEAFGSDYEKFQEGIRELPGLKTIDGAIGGGE